MFHNLIFLNYQLNYYLYKKKLVESEFIFSEKASDFIFKLVKENLPLQKVSFGNLLNLKLDLKFPFLKLIFLFPILYLEF